MQQASITPDSVVCRSRNQVSTEIDGEAVLLSIEMGKYYGMNKILTAIWNWLEQPTTVSEICAKVVQTYEVSDDVCRNDVEKVLAELRDEGLVDIR